MIMYKIHGQISSRATARCILGGGFDWSGDDSQWVLSNAYILAPKNAFVQAECYSKV